jgi:hypothetical protein
MDRRDAIFTMLAALTAPSPKLLGASPRLFGRTYAPFARVGIEMYLYGWHIYLSHDLLEPDGEWLYTGFSCDLIIGSRAMERVHNQFGLGDISHRPFYESVMESGIPTVEQWVANLRQMGATDEMIEELFKRATPVSSPLEDGPKSWKKPYGSYCLWRAEEDGDLTFFG